MKLMINYDNTEYLHLYNEEDKQEKKQVLNCIKANILILVLFIICSLVLEGLGKIAAYLILMFLAVIISGSGIQSFSISEYGLMSRTTYGKSLYLLSEWKRKLTNKRDNEIFAKMDNGEVLVFDGSNYVSLSWLLKDFNYDDPVPETFDTLTITGKDGKVNINFS